MSFSVNNRHDMSDYKRNFYETMYSSRDSRRNDSRSSLVKKYTRTRYDVVFDLLPGGKRLLDVACGTGEFAFRAREKYDEVCGVDLTEVNITHAERNAVEWSMDNVSFLRADADDLLPYEDSCFDTVTCIASLQFMFDPYHAIDEFSRVLKTDGTLVIQVVNAVYLPYRLTLLFGRFPVTADQPGWDGGTLHYFTFSSLSGLFREKGFRVVKKTASGMLAGLRTWWPSLLNGDIIIRGTKL